MMTEYERKLIEALKGIESQIKAVNKRLSFLMSEPPRLEIKDEETMNKIREAFKAMPYWTLEVKDDTVREMRKSGNVQSDDAETGE